LSQAKLWPCKGLEKETGREVGFDFVPLFSSAEKWAPLRDFQDGEGALFKSGCCIKMFQVVIGPELSRDKIHSPRCVNRVKKTIDNHSLGEEERTMRGSKSKRGNDPSHNPGIEKEH
jgi:hypothetical protein